MLFQTCIYSRISSVKHKRKYFLQYNKNQWDPVLFRPQRSLEYRILCFSEESKVRKYMRVNDGHLWVNNLRTIFKSKRLTSLEYW